MSRIRLISGILALVLILVAVACGDDASSPTTPPPVATPTSTGNPPAATGNAAETGFFLNVVSPQDESVVRTSNLDIRGRTVVDAVVTVNGNTIEVDATSNFSTTVQLAEGPNSIEVLASDFQGRQASRLLSVIYVR